MSYIQIKEDTIDSLLEVGTKLASKLLSLLTEQDTKIKNNWLDNQDVCLLLKKSKSQLQYLRKSGQLSYFRLENKIYYREADVMEYLTKKKVL